MGIFSPFVHEFSSYKIFVFCDILYYVLYVLLFYFLLDQLIVLKRKTWIAIATAMLFGVGYPLNILVFGFGYFQTGFLLIAMIVILCSLFGNNKLSFNWYVFLLTITIMGLSNSYIMFLPVILTTLAIWLIYLCFRKRKISSRQFGIVILFCFLVSGIISLQYYKNSFPSNAYQQIIARDGYIYKELYSDFLWFIPLAVYGALRILQNKKQNNAMPIFLICQISSMGIMLILGLFGKISPYYFYKNNYLLWFIVMILFGYAVIDLFDTNRLLFLSLYICAFSLVLFIGAGFDQKINQLNSLFNPIPRSGSLLPVLTFNIEKICEKNGFIEYKKLQLYSRAKILGENEGQKEIPLISIYGRDGLWYQELTNLFPLAKTGNDRVFLDQELVYKHWEKNDLEYIVYYDNGVNNRISLNELDNNHTRIFENEAGSIYKK